MSRVRLTRALMLEAPQVLGDQAGGFSQSWVALGRVWAEVLPGQGQDSRAVGGAVAVVPYRITLRAAPVGAPMRPRPDQRFRDGSRVFSILAVTERDAAGRYLLCFAREEVAA